MTRRCGRAPPAWLALAPLSEHATAAVVRRELGPDVPDGVCRSCHAATGGNPFYLRELLAGGEAPGTSTREAMAPAGITRSVLRRLIDDPFVLPQRKDGQETLTYNHAPRWTSEFYPACSDALEPADPLEEQAVSATPPGGTEHLFADGAFLSWFAPEPVDLDPGLYDAIGVFDGYSSAC